MKISNLIAGLLCLFLSFSCLASARLTQTVTNTTVLDIDGHELQTDTNYYIHPTTSGNGGGLALASRDRTCPFYVMQENLEPSNGLPLRFLTMENKQQFISLSTDLNIVFYAATICVQSTAWRLGGIDEVTGRRYVMSGAVTGHPGIDTVRNWFKLEKYGGGNGYMIVFCPNVCSFCKVVCGNVGVFSENGKRWLALSDQPLIVGFKKT
ncbi:unnamed protein product [Ilex paraguariensis]|uniref:Miraculin-like n=1 Tax=Ilex paraguariensis TaxID=185542 RepID=A0ABC8S406_9AQUA